MTFEGYLLNKNITSQAQFQELENNSEPNRPRGRRVHGLKKALIFFK